MGSLITRAEKILTLIQERDPVALKNAYRFFFESIEVGELDSSGKRELRFNLMESEELTDDLAGLTDFSGVGNRRTDFGYENKIGSEGEDRAKLLFLLMSTSPITTNHYMSLFLTIKPFPLLGKDREYSVHQ